MTPQSGATDRLNREIEAAKMMLPSTESTESAKADRIEDIMNQLEDFAEIDPPTACIMMTALWPLADQLFMHHICDGIDLWIVNNCSSGVREHIARLSDSESEIEMRSHWKGLIANLAEESSPAQQSNPDELL